jgi:hypothetical protein
MDLNALNPNLSPRRVRRGDGEKRCDIFVTQLGKNRGKEISGKTTRAFIHFDADPSEPLGQQAIRGCYFFGAPGGKRLPPERSRWLTAWESPASEVPDRRPRAPARFNWSRW